MRSRTSGPLWTACRAVDGVQSRRIAAKSPRDGAEVKSHFPAFAGRFDRYDCFTGYLRNGRAAGAQETLKRVGRALDE